MHFSTFILLATVYASCCIPPHLVRNTKMCSLDSLLTVQLWLINSAFKLQEVCTLVIYCTVLKWKRVNPWHSTCMTHSLWWLFCIYHSGMLSEVHADKPVTKEELQYLKKRRHNKAALISQSRVNLLITSHLISPCVWPVLIIGTSINQSPLGQRVVAAI